VSSTAAGCNYLWDIAGEGQMLFNVDLTAFQDVEP
jgi:hypothetical protein